MKSRIFAVLLCLVLICSAVFYGAYSGWKEEKNEVEELLSSLQDLLDTRVETASNILTVARRHMNTEDDLFVRVENEKNVLAGENSLSDKSRAHADLTKDGENLLSHLASLPTVQADERDKMYVENMLPQMLSQSENITAQSDYNKAALRFNENFLKNPVSSSIARLMGMDECEVFSSEFTEKANENEAEGEMRK